MVLPLMTRSWNISTRVACHSLFNLGNVPLSSIVRSFAKLRVFQRADTTTVSGDADYVIYIIDASIPLQALEEGGRNQDAAADKGALRRAKDLTVVVNKM